MLGCYSAVLGEGQDPLGKVDEPMQLCTEQRVRAQDILPPKLKSTRFVLLLCAAVQAGTNVTHTAQAGCSLFLTPSLNILL